MKNIQLLVLDMDGTSYMKMGGIVPENIEPIKQIQAQGVHVAFVTGRPVLAKLNNIEGLGLVGKHSIIAGCNGGCIYDIENKKVLASNPIDSNIAKEIFELANLPEFLGTEVWGYVDNLEQAVVKITAEEFGSRDIYDKEDNFFHGEYLKYDDIKDNFNYKFFKILAIGSKPGFIQKIRETLNVEVSSNDDVVAEINAKGINKKFAIDWFSEYLNIPVENIMAVGDGMNDLPMIEYVGVGVAIQNSVQALKDIADLYENTHGHDGAVKNIIEKYILKKEK